MLSPATRVMLWQRRQFLSLLSSLQVKAKVSPVTCMAPRDPILLPFCPLLTRPLYSSDVMTHFCLRAFALSIPSAWRLSPQDIHKAYPLTSLTSLNITFLASLFPTTLFNTATYPPHPSPGTPPPLLYCHAFCFSR